uniref:Uncharacterized protein n=1 Tax=Oryza nivara TaxID=4536 RepID=A0A0E0G3K0_ORYNI
MTIEMYGATNRLRTANGWPGLVLAKAIIACKTPKYLFKVGHGLEDTGKPFLWVVKKSEVAGWKRPEP